MDEIRVTESLDEMTIIIKALLNDIAESFISVGFYLKRQNRTSCISRQDTEISGNMPRTHLE